MKITWITWCIHCRLVAVVTFQDSSSATEILQFQIWKCCKKLLGLQSNELDQRSSSCCCCSTSTTSIFIWLKFQVPSMVCVCLVACGIYNLLKRKKAPPQPGRIAMAIQNREFDILVSWAAADWSQIPKLSRFWNFRSSTENQFWLNCSTRSTKPIQRGQNVKIAIWSKWAQSLATQSCAPRVESRRQNRSTNFVKNSSPLISNLLSLCCCNKRIFVRHNFGNSLASWQINLGY